MSPVSVAKVVHTHSVLGKGENEYVTVVAPEDLKKVRQELTTSINDAKGELWKEVGKKADWNCVKEHEKELARLEKGKANQLEVTQHLKAVVRAFNDSNFGDVINTEIENQMGRIDHACAKHKEAIKTAVNEFERLKAELQILLDGHQQKVADAIGRFSAQVREVAEISVAGREHLAGIVRDVEAVKKDILATAGECRAAFASYAKQVETVQQVACSSIEGAARVACEEAEKKAKVETERVMAARDKLIAEAEECRKSFASYVHKVSEAQQAASEQVFKEFEDVRDAAAEALSRDVSGALDMLKESMAAAQAAKELLAQTAGAANDVQRDVEALSVVVSSVAGSGLRGRLKWLLMGTPPKPKATG